MQAHQVVSVGPLALSSALAPRRRRMPPSPRRSPAASLGGSIADEQAAVEVLVVARSLDRAKGRREFEEEKPERKEEIVPVRSKSKPVLWHQPSPRLRRTELAGGQGSLEGGGKAENGERGRVRDAGIEEARALPARASNAGTPSARGQHHDHSAGLPCAAPTPPW